MVPESEAWSSPPASLNLSDADVHIWRIALDPSANVVDRLSVLLAPDEQARAARFLAPIHGTRFRVGRGMLRLILGRYLELAPERVDFVYGAHGKPSLIPALHDSGLRFNLAHSKDVALLAVARGRELGVDVEATRPLDDAERIVERFFSEREQADFFRVAPDQRQEAFFRGWVRKEAYIKAIGTGLAMPLADFDVTLAPGEPPRLLHVVDRPDEPLRWTFAEIAPGPRLQGAVAVEGDGWRLCQFDAEHGAHW